MKRRTSLTLAVLSWWAATVNATPLSDETISTAKQLRDEALVGSRAWNIVERLTTEVGPRLAGSEADARARAWAVSKLASYGFEHVRIERCHGWSGEGY